MEVSVEETGGLGRRMTVQVPAERIDGEVESRLRSLSQTVRLDGFRPGKVPIRVLEQKYGRQVRLEVIDQIVNTTLQEALAQENLQPAGTPAVEPKISDPGEALEYQATFELLPDLAGQINYSFSVTRPVVEIVDADVQDMIENLRNQRATWSPVERKAAMDDQVTIDFEGTVDGTAFTGNKATGVPLVLGSNTMIPGFEQQLVDATAGEEKTIMITFPEDYPSAEVAGKEASFTVKIHSVSEKSLPEVDDEFARAFGISEGGIDSLMREITSNMERELQGLIKSKLKSQVFDGLLADNPVEVPSSLVDSEIAALQQKDEYRGQDADSLRQQAEKRVRLGVIVSEIAKQNMIQLDPDRVRALVESIAASYEKPEEVVQWYYGNQEMLSGVQSAVIEEQVVDWVIENSGVNVNDESTTFSALVEEAKQSQQSQG